ncbi:MAG TPA: four helix bundle protein, partial [Kiritimatiellia bacterium]|nr:four helix bundle protein [Kiritimatiellia bacterium]
QLDRASTSIPLNIAEGNGMYTEADRCRFFDIARGTALECPACLDVMIAKKRMDSTESGAGPTE